MQWTDLVVEDATWLSLEDKAVFKGVGSDRDPSKDYKGKGGYNVIKSAVRIYGK